jgi:hypothetical protein
MNSHLQNQKSSPQGRASNQGTTRLHKSFSRIAVLIFVVSFLFTNMQDYAQTTFQKIYGGAIATGDHPMVRTIDGGFAILSSLDLNFLMLTCQECSETPDNRAFCTLSNFANSKF